MTRKIHFISEWYFNPFKQSFLSCLTQSQKKKKNEKKKNKQKPDRHTVPSALTLTLRLATKHGKWSQLRAKALGVGPRSSVRCEASTEWESLAQTPGLHTVSHCSPGVRHTRSVSQRSQMPRKMKLLILQGCAREGKWRGLKPKKRRTAIPGILDAAHLDRQLVICSGNVLYSCAAGNHSIQVKVQSCTRSLSRSS